MKPLINKETEDFLKNLETKNENETVQFYSKDIDPIDDAIESNKLEITHLVIQKNVNRILFVLNNGTIIEKNITDILGLANANMEQLNNYENMGTGILWKEIPQADISLHGLIADEIYTKFKLKVA